jgi:hypothetical protein
LRVVATGVGFIDWLFGRDREDIQLLEVELAVAMEINGAVLRYPENLGC